MIANTFHSIPEDKKLLMFSTAIDLYLSLLSYPSLPPSLLTGLRRYALVGQALHCCRAAFRHALYRRTTRAAPLCTTATETRQTSKTGTHLLLRLQPSEVVFLACSEPSGQRLQLPRGGPLDVVPYL